MPTDACQFFWNARHAKQYFAQKKGIVVSFARMEMLHVHPFRQRGRGLTAAELWENQQ